MLKSEKLFDKVGVRFMKWIDDNTLQSDKVCLVAYNGGQFDFSFLRSCCQRYKVMYSKRIFFELDPLSIYKKIPLTPIPVNKKLGTMYKYVTGFELINAHNAVVDVSALLCVFVYGPVWKERENFILPVEKKKK